MLQARNKPADGSGHVNQKGVGPKSGGTPVKKPPTAQKGSVKTPTPKQGQPQGTPKPAAPPPLKKDNKKKRHQQYDLVVTIDLVSSSVLIWPNAGSNS